MTDTMPTHPTPTAPRRTKPSSRRKCGICPHCRREYALAPLDGTLQVHPKGGPHCSGAGELPVRPARVGNYALAAKGAASMGLTVSETAEALRISPRRAAILLGPYRAPETPQLPWPGACLPPHCEAPGPRELQP